MLWDECFGFCDWRPYGPCARRSDRRRLTEAPCRGSTLWYLQMGHDREHMPSMIKIPKDLADELERLASAEHKPRVAYAVDVLWRDVRRSRQREALQASAGSWKI